MDAIMLGATKIIQSELMKKWEKQEKDKKKMLQYSYNVQKDFERHEEIQREKRIKNVKLTPKNRHTVTHHPLCR